MCFFLGGGWVGQRNANAPVHFDCFMNFKCNRKHPYSSIWSLWIPTADIPPHAVPTAVPALTSTKEPHTIQQQ